MGSGATPRSAGRASFRYHARTMRSRPRRSSAQVVLVLLGAAAIAGCGDSGPDSGAARRKTYATREDCVADWGDPRDCEEQRVQQRDGTQRHVYVGGGGWGRGMWGGGTSGSGSANGGTSRGGFGASGRAHGSGAS